MKRKALSKERRAKGFSLSHKMKVFVLLELVGVVVLAAVVFGLLPV
ncbi:MAG: hypothetical protein V1787_04550 [Candidatus Micrarchaeota archaeon]